MKALLAAIVIAAGFSAFVAWNVNRPVAKDGLQLFNIAKGDSVARIGTRLEDAGLIRSAAFFRLTAWSRGHEADFKAGSYELSPAMTTRDLELALVGGTAVSNEAQITVIEGWTLSDIAKYLSDEGLSSKETFAAQAGTSAKQVNKLPDWKASYGVLADKPANASLEGYLFPDTYRIYADGDASAIVRRMLANMDGKFTPAMRAAAKAKGRTLHQILTMASILEREVRGDEDMRLVSDLFWRRVDANRGLEADSTVNYCTGKSLASVTHADLQVDCPWNTYKWRGLPPGPIGNPGLAAIKAALDPKPNPYWYFLTDPEGTVHYAKTLEEHIQNRKHLR